MVPSPLEIAEQFLSGELPKPVKLRRKEDGRYALIEGRLKYWGWVIAFNASRPIPALIEGPYKAQIFQEIINEEQRQTREY